MADKIRYDQIQSGISRGVLRRNPTSEGDWPPQVD